MQSLDTKVFGPVCLAELVKITKCVFSRLVVLACQCDRHICLHLNHRQNHLRQNKVFLAIYVLPNYIFMDKKLGEVEGSTHLVF